MWNNNIIEKLIGGLHVNTLGQRGLADKKSSGIPHEQTRKQQWHYTFKVYRFEIVLSTSGGHCMWWIHSVSKLYMKSRDMWPSMWPILWICALHLTHPSVHTHSSEHTTQHTPLTEDSCQTWDSNPQPSGYKSNSLTIRPQWFCDTLVLFSSA